MRSNSLRFEFFTSDGVDEGDFPNLLTNEMRKMNKKVIAIAAALAVVLTSVAVAVPSMQSTDAAFSSVTAAPVAYAKEGNVRAILYQDKVLMLDISEAATLDKGNMYTVEVSTVKTYSNVNVKGISMSPIGSVAGKIVINVDGKAGDNSTPLITTTGEAQTASLYITVKNSSNTTVGSQITLTYKATNGSLCPMTLNLYKNNDDGWDAESIGSTATKTVSNCTLQNRGVKVGLNETQKTIQDMTASIDTSTEFDSNYTLTDPNGKLKLIGWSEDSQKVNGTVDVAAEEMTVEDLLYEAGDAGAITGTNSIELYAVYGAINYNVYIQDHFKTGEESWVNAEATIKGSTLVGETTKNNVPVAKASVTPQVSSIGYGILSIELQDIADNLNVYTFDIKAYGAIDDGGNVTGDALDDITFTAVSSNVYKVSDVKSSIYIQITANAVESTPGDLYFDSVKNVISNNEVHGEAILSLDLLSTTTLTSGSTLKMDGTIYTTSDDDIRTYSSLANYTTLSDITAGPITIKMGGGSVNLDDSGETGRLNNTTMTLYNATLGEADSYDMSLKLAAGYSIYALQGTWNNNGETTNTPWALADN